MALEPPGVNRQIAVASPTQRPWMDASGWRFLRAAAAAGYSTSCPPGRGPLAAAEAHLHGADALCRSTLRDLPAVAQDAAPSCARSRRCPGPTWPRSRWWTTGPSWSGEVMNLLSRRNLLWRPGAEGRGPATPPARVAGSRCASGAPPSRRRPPRIPASWPRADPAAASATTGALLRVYGSEAVLCRLQGDRAGTLAPVAAELRQRRREGVRVRIRGGYPRGTAVTDRTGSRAPIDQTSTGDTTELTVPPFALWAVVDLQR